MKTVHKYLLDDVRTQVSTYEGARFIHVANQRERIAVWAEVNTLARECVRTLHMVGTGTDVPAGTDHIGSALVAAGEYVFHIYANRETA